MHSRSSPSWGFWLAGLIVGMSVDLWGQTIRQGLIVSAGRSIVGTSGDGYYASQSHLSSDGRFLAFHSDSTDLVAGDNNGYCDAFIRDLWTGRILRLSVGSGGSEANGSSFVSDISPDGWFVVFESEASNIAGPDTNQACDVFLADVRNFAAGSTSVVISRITHADSASWGGVYCQNVAMNVLVAVSFLSDATNHVAGDTNGSTDLFVRRVIPAPSLVRRVSLRGSGGQVTNGSIFEGRVSSNLSGAVIVSDSPQLHPAASNGLNQVFRINGVASIFGSGWLPTIDLISGDSSGNPANGECWLASIHWFGHVCYISEASNLVPGDSNGNNDAFFFNAVPGFPVPTTRVNITSSGGQSGSPLDLGVTYLSMSDGPDVFVAYDSDAADIVQGDSNFACDVFVARVAAPASVIRLGDCSRDELALGSSFGALSDDGQHVSFVSEDLNLPLAGTDLGNGPFVCHMDRWLDIGGGTSIGSTATLQFSAAGDVGRTYVLAASLDCLPGITIGSCSAVCDPRAIPLALDDLFVYTLSQPPGWPAPGTIGPTGTVSIGLQIPPAPLLSGVTVYLAAVTLTGSASSFNGLAGVSNAARLDIN